MGEAHGSGWWRGWGALVLPTTCPGCGLLDETVCAGCRDAVLRAPLRHRVLADGTRVVGSAGWRGPARGLVTAAKERGRADVAPVLALGLARAVAQAGFPPAGATRAGATRAGAEEAGAEEAGAAEAGAADAGPAAVAVPARRSRTLVLVGPPARYGAVLRRGDRPTERLAGAAARALRDSGADVLAAGPRVPRLVHTRRVLDQAGLDRSRRAANVDGAFAVRRPDRRAGPGVDVLLVDDVLTTGATLVEAARAVRAAGLHVVGAAVVAVA